MVVHPLGAEDAHQIVFEREEERRTAGIALTAGAATQLVVDAAAFMALGANDVEAAGVERLALLFGDRRRCLSRFLAMPVRRVGALLALGHEPLLEQHVRIAAELNVGAATGHVGGDGDGAGNAGLRDDMGFLLVVAGVEDLMRNLCPSSKARTGSRIFRSSWCRRGRLARLRASIDQRADGSCISPARCDRLRRAGRRGSRPYWSAFRPRRGRKCPKIRRPRSAPFRSCRRASGKGGNNSGR